MRRVFLCLVALAVVLTGFSGRSWALFDMVSTTGEEVALLFAKMGGQKLNFADLARYTRASRDARGQADYAEILKQEEMRLRMNLMGLKPKEQFVVAATEILVRVQDTPPKGIALEFPGQAIPYFPYRFGGQSYGVIVNDLEQFLFIPLKGPEFEAAKAKIGVSKTVLFALEARPVKAFSDKKRPFDGREQWLMMADIGRLSLHAVNGNDQIWEFVNDKVYLSQQGREIINLYGD